RGTEGIEQQHALPRLAQMPRGPGPEHAGADDDGIPGGFVHLRVLRPDDPRSGEAGREGAADGRAARDAFTHGRVWCRVRKAGESPGSRLAPGEASGFSPLSSPGTMTH